jgi:hypothetical protein
MSWTDDGLADPAQAVCHAATVQRCDDGGGHRLGIYDSCCPSVGESTEITEHQHQPMTMVCPPAGCEAELIAAQSGSRWSDRTNWTTESE